MTKFVCPVKHNQMEVDPHGVIVNMQRDRRYRYDRPKVVTEFLKPGINSIQVQKSIDTDVFVGAQHGSSSKADQKWTRLAQPLAERLKCQKRRTLPEAANNLSHHQDETQNPSPFC